MPLRQYFSWVGGVLLATLFVLDAYFPKPAAVEKAPGNLPVIRIHSDRKWPERVVYDTSLPTIPTSMANAEVIGGIPAATRIRGAFAMLPMSAGQSPKTAAKIREMNPPHQVKIARRRAPSPGVAMARRPQFGWSDENFWRQGQRIKSSFPEPWPG
jgi:hypothetical protein